MDGDDSLVVVFGGAGYIGSWVVRHLLQEGFRVRVFDNFLFSRDGIEDLVHPRLQIIEADIRDIEAVSSAINGADAVILLSAIVGHRVGDVAWSTTRTINFLASSVVLDAAVEHGVQRFIFASTNSIYGVQSGLMYETTIPEPASLYSRLKLRMEGRVINAKKRGSFHPTALRIATCHGFAPRMRFDLVANGLIRDAVCKKQLTIVSGEQTRALVHVEDAARAFILCLKAHENLISGEIFNVGANDQNVQINQLVNIVKTLAPDTTVKVIEGEPDLVGYKLSSTKIEKVLDFTPQWTIERSMAQVRDLLIEGRYADTYSLKYNNT